MDKVTLEMSSQVCDDYIETLREVQYAFTLEGQHEVTHLFKKCEENIEQAKHLIERELKKQKTYRK